MNLSDLKLEPVTRYELLKTHHRRVNEIENNGISYDRARILMPFAFPGYLALLNDFRESPEALEVVHGSQAFSYRLSDAMIASIEQATRLSFQTPLELRFDKSDSHKPIRIKFKLDPDSGLVISHELLAQAYHKGKFSWSDGCELEADRFYALL